MNIFVLKTIFSVIKFWKQLKVMWVPIHFKLIELSSYLTKSKIIINKSWIKSK